jgi:acyl-CoA synthetase (AMP-forming)/AMP-acid ligase II
MPGHTLNTEDLRQYCKKELHNWKCPKRIVLVDAIPKNTMGKVLKDAVKAMFLDGNPP